MAASRGLMTPWSLPSSPQAGIAGITSHPTTSSNADLFPQSSISSVLPHLQLHHHSNLRAALPGIRIFLYKIIISSSTFIPPNFQLGPTVDLSDKFLKLHRPASFTYLF
ncbi:hypothetical protein O181_063197 [Austropuccinia psidii MF-1]|uniref:Uncharacterized protein n=1 Tax=Austropuccinia psidii MF-1 TaxID=1389203 RepID=A0A9Q3I141_9BASI|nr:hypothetical protein [Austropuccinia psidii MF-1]